MVKGLTDLVAPLHLPLTGKNPAQTIGKNPAQTKVLDFDKYTAVSLDGTVYALGAEVSLRSGHTEPLADDEVVKAFKSAMRMLAAGVVMVTTRVDNRPWGLTISACCSVSVEPPQILVSLGRHTVSLRAILADQKFGVSILAEGQKALAEYGAAPGAPKFVDSESPEEGAPEGSKMLTPMIADALSHLHCDVARVYDGGDHAVVLGTVRSVVFPSLGDDSPRPLLYFNGAFCRFGGPIQD